MSEIKNNRNWFTVNRKLLFHPLWLAEKFTRGQAWVDLIGLAAHTDTFFFVRGIRIKIKRGQLAWSQPRLGNRWRWSRSKVRRFLNDLENEQQITQKKNNVTQILTLINYDKYQREKTAKCSAERTANDTADNTANDSHTTINNNEKQLINHGCPIKFLTINT